MTMIHITDFVFETITASNRASQLAMKPALLVFL